MAENDQKQPETVNFDDSQAIRTATYNPDGTLTILFASGREYPYRGVPEGLWEEMKDAASVGRFYHDNIKGKFA